METGYVVEKITDGLLELMGEKPFEEITVSDIVRRAVDPHEFPHGIAVVNGVLHTLVGQTELALQHGLDLYDPEFLPTI